MNNVSKALLLSLTVLCFSSLSLAAKIPPLQRAVVVVLENTPFSKASQNPIFKDLMNRGSTLTNFWAVTNPSQPNYLAMVAGSTLGCRDDRNIDLPDSHLGDLLEQKGYSWRTYAEDFPGNCFLGSSAKKYVRKHVPFLSFTNIQNSPTRCSYVQNDKTFYTDFKAQNLPTYSLWVPNLDNDGHDRGVDFAADWLNKNIVPLMTTNYGTDTTWIITFDEGNVLNNQIFTLLIGPNIKKGNLVATKYNHYSLLRTFEDSWALDSLRREDSKATAIDGIWK